MSAQPTNTTDAKEFGTKTITPEGTLPNHIRRQGTVNHIDTFLQ